MDDVAPRELISLADDEGNSVTVSVLGRDTRWTAGLDAEIVVRTPFVCGRIALVLSTSKLESWAAALNRLDAGEDVAWMEWDRGPSVSIQLTGERDCPEVVVEIADLPADPRSAEPVRTSSWAGVRPNFRRGARNVSKEEVRWDFRGTWFSLAVSVRCCRHLSSTASISG
ncbi:MULTISPECIES: DUF5959 family protein [unclassified Streptomyces]|uniref:DUF5959 family protein n=1 Tax=unclassified Streptomyces TaxID=2593676 RepID=UPI002E79EF27|nr:MULTISPECIES: DUF5959 family protein [unclassified Streptomyces]MEE1759787.1 DUF5959 family protein [Streptomyces sp. SP18BB07]MEE1830184.1 DUF5959 family protein [Streptomyces sp. SP17KL33]